MARHRSTLKKQPRLNRGIALAIIAACTVIGGLFVYISNAASSSYSRLDCFFTSNKGYASAYACYEHSIEGQTAQAFIAVLGRIPEKSAFQYWSNVYATYQSAPQQTLINKLLLGPEAQNKFGKLSNSDKVTYLYNTVLHRQPDTSGKAYWLKRFNTDKNLGHVIASFINTNQSRNKMQAYVQTALETLGTTWRPTRMGKTVSPRGVYANWIWKAPASGFNRLSHNLTIQSFNPSAYYFWAHQYKYVNGDGAYIGLQSVGAGPVRKQAIFSVFSAGIAAKQQYCKVEKSGFDGYNTSGTSCIIPYNWVKGRAYQLTSSLSASDGTGSWWTGTVTDTTTGKSTVIGTIKVPKSWKGTGDWSTMWTENYQSTATSCNTIPYSKVTFSAPIANGSIKPIAASKQFSEKYECNNSRSTTPSRSVTQEVGVQ